MRRSPYKFSVFAADTPDGFADFVLTRMWDKPLPCNDNSPQK